MNTRTNLYARLTTLSEEWDVELRNDFNVGNHYTDLHARELRALLETNPSDEALVALANRWDDELQREFHVGSDWTHYQARAIRAIVNDKQES